MSKKPQNTITDSELDLLLEETGFVHVPEHFEQQVMESLNALPEPQTNKPAWWQWLALIGGGIPALMQIAAFVFSAWNIATVG
jgi:hypothetical protein